MSLTSGVAHDNIVAPFTGAWIEMVTAQFQPAPLSVAPFTGAWIEITGMSTIWCVRSSLPSRERGLKSGLDRRR